MIYTNFFRVLLLMILSLSLGSCEDASLDPPNNAGKLIGWVTIENPSCNGNSTSLAGVMVSLVGTSHQAQTDDAGRWELNDVPAGSYDVSYERPDLSTRMSYSVQYAGNGRAVFPQVHLQPVPDQRVLQILNTKLLWWSNLIQIKFDSMLTEDLVVVSGTGTLDTIMAGTMIDSGSILAKPTSLKAIQLEVAIDQPSVPHHYKIAISDRPGGDPRDLTKITGLAGGVLLSGATTLTWDVDWLISHSRVRSGTLYLSTWGSSCDPRSVRDPETGVEGYTGIADIGSKEISIVLQ